MNGKHIINYIRKSQSADALRLALSEVAGLAILPEEATLTRIYTSGSKTIYAFDRVSLTVDYKHTPLVEGVTYPAGTVIGSEIIRVYSQQAGEPEQWWRNLDWSGGMPLAGIFSSLIIPDRLVRFYWVSDWIDDNGETQRHIRADFAQDQPTLQDRFWQQIHDSEERTNLPLTAAPELANVDDGVDASVNMLDFYFRYLYGARGIIVDLDDSILGDSKNKAIQNFLRREVPVGSTPVLRIAGQEAYDEPGVPVEGEPAPPPPGSGGEDEDPPLP